MIEISLDRIGAAAFYRVVSKLPTKAPTDKSAESSAEKTCTALADDLAKLGARCENAKRWPMDLRNELMQKIHDTANQYTAARGLQ
jgi:hypothetical protein